VELDVDHSGAASVAVSMDGGRRRGEDSILVCWVAVQEGDWRGCGGAGRKGDEAAAASCPAKTAVDLIITETCQQQKSTENRL
jgi:hypothetical protein